MRPESIHESTALETERSCLGSMMFLPSAIDTLIAEGLKAEHFRWPNHRTLFVTLADLAANGVDCIDVVTVANAMESTGTLVGFGGIPELALVAGSVPHAAHARRYAESVKLEWCRRQAQNRCRQWLTELEAGDPTNTVDDMQVFSSNITAETVSAEGYADATTILNEHLEAIENPVHRIPTGFSGLDISTGGGFGSGELIIIGARTSVGKTAFACNLAANAIKADRATYFASVEMVRHKIGGRILRSMSLGPEVISHNKFAASKLWIDSTNRSLDRIAAAARRQIMQHGHGLLIVDYLQLIHHGDKRIQRHERVGEISGTLKRLAVEMNVPVIALAQVGRDAAKQNRPPALHDLRESGSIEQDADMVLFLHRPCNEKDGDRDGTYDPRDEQREPITVDVAKNREGSCGALDMVFDKKSMRFHQVEKGDPWGDSAPDVGQPVYSAPVYDPASDPYADPLVYGGK